MNGIECECDGPFVVFCVIFCCCGRSITKGVRRSNTLIAYQIVINGVCAASLMMNRALNVYSARSIAMMIPSFFRHSIRNELNKNNYEREQKRIKIETAAQSLMAHQNSINRNSDYTVNDNKRLEWNDEKSLAKHQFDHNSVYTN